MRLLYDPLPRDPQLERLRANYASALSDYAAAVKPKLQPVADTHNLDPDELTAFVMDPGITPDDRADMRQAIAGVKTMPDLVKLLTKYPRLARLIKR